MASEDGTWKRLRNVLRDVHVSRVENLTEDGMPDVNGCHEGCEFWIELKQLDEWPKRKSTKVKVGMRESQLRWIAARGKAGGNVHVLAQVADMYLLFWWKSVGRLYEGMTREELYKEALYITRSMNKTDLLLLITRRGEDYGRTFNNDPDSVGRGAGVS